MITASFSVRGDEYLGFSISGHADFAERGADIVCAAVSSAVSMAANGITEVCKLKANVTCQGVNVTLSMEKPCLLSNVFIVALKLQLSLIALEYKSFLAVEVIDEKEVDLIELKGE